MTKLKRFLQVEVRGDDGEFSASLASEYPVQRYLGAEVLDCTPEAVDLQRARDGLPVLGNHDAQTLIGRARSVRVEGRKLRGRLTFFDTAAGREARTAVESGHRELSVGYEVLDTRNEADGVIRVTRWRPYEVSLVSIPADPTVGINRSHNHGDPMNTTSIDGAGQEDAREINVQSRSQRRAASKGEGAYREDTANILALARRHADQLEPDAAERAISEGWTYDRFRQAVFANVGGSASLKLADEEIVSRRSAGLSSQSREWQDLVSEFSLSRALLSQVDPSTYLRSAAREAEICQEMSRSAPIKTSGLVVPLQALFGQQMRAMQHRSLSAGVSALGGSSIQTSIEVALFADVLRAMTVAGKLGARVLPGLTDNVAIPRKTAATTAGWLTETGAASTTDIATDNLTLTPRRIGAFTDVSKQLMIQSSLAMEQIVQKDLSDTIMLEMDRVALLGTGASNQPRGILNTVGVGSVVGGTNGLQIAWSHITDLERTVAAANGMLDMGTLGYTINPALRSAMKRTLKVAGVGTELLMGETPVDEAGLSRLNGYKAAVSTLLPSNGTKGTSSGVCSTLVFGDWSQLFIGQFGPGVEFVVDPYTLATTGQVRITANLFGDVGVRYSQSFACMTDALTA